MRPIAVVLVLMLAAGTFRTAESVAVAAPDGREMQARQAYAAGNYRDALDIYVQLYAEKLHPNFLRNIGRCYQNLGEPDKAINSFREYLRKAKDVGPDERAEVDGYIAEMEELKKRKQREASEASPPAGEKPHAEPAVVALAVPPPASAQPQSTTVNLAASPPAQGSDSSSGGAAEAKPLYEKWWFWAIVGGVVATSVGVAAAAGVFTKTNEPSCAPPRTCP